MLDLIRNGRAPEALQQLADATGFMSSKKRATLWQRLPSGMPFTEALADRSKTSPSCIRARTTNWTPSTASFNCIEHATTRSTAAESYVVDEASTGRRWTICRGDRIVMNKGVMEGLSEPVRNGQTGTVVRVVADGAVRIRFDGQDKRTATIRLKPEMDVVPVGLGYVMSTTKYQGGQAPVVLITPGSPEIASQNSGYSQTTRMVEHVEVLVDKQRWDRGEGPIKTLGQAWSTPEVKTMASEVLGEPKIEREYAPERVEHFEAITLGSPTCV